MITSDEAMEEIREARRRISKQCDHDPDKYIAYLKTVEHKYAAQIERYRREHGKPLVRATPDGAEKQQETEAERRIAGRIGQDETDRRAAH